MKSYLPLFGFIAATLWMVATTSAQELPPQDEPRDVGPGEIAIVSEVGSATTDGSDASPAEADRAADDGGEATAAADPPQPIPASQTRGQSEAGKKKQERLKKAAAGAYKVLFYDNDFLYLEDVDFHDYELGDGLKRMRVADHSTLDIGGQYRIRPQIEHNIRGLGLTGRDDQFVLHRVRLYANWEYGGWLRVYGEYLDAASEYEDFAPRIIEVDRSDLLNGFVDVRLAECECGKLWGRVGRQELLYGSQRLISPLDWANTRRTFDGAKLFWRGENCNVDAFWTRPVIPDPHNFDNPDNSQELMGVFATWKKVWRGSLDTYFLRYDENAGAPDFDFNTFGVRHSGDWCDWLWEVEGGYQFGNFGAADVNAGFYTVGLGRRLPDRPWKPTLWAYYDWASGSDNLGAGFNHLFPLSHRYLGYMDLFGRRNIEDLNFQINVEPCDCLSLQLWCHFFQLQNGNDVPYAVNMKPAPVGLPVVPGGSRELGQEVDFYATWKIDNRKECVFGYCHFFSGDWFRTNPTPGLFRGDGDFYYMHWQVNF